VTSNTVENVFFSTQDVCQSCVRLFSTVGAQTTKLLINLTLRSDSQRSLVSEFVNLLLVGPFVIMVVVSRFLIGLFEFIRIPYASKRFFFNSF
jgi:hypothetical protein